MNQSLLIRNKLYSYELVDDELGHPNHLRSFGWFRTIHNGGFVLIGTNNNVNLIVSDMYRSNSQNFELVIEAYNVLGVE